MATVGAFAVPIFFMVSCYFSHNATRKKLVHSIVHTIQLIAIAYAINLLRIFISESCSISGMISQIGLPLVGMDRMGTNNVWFCGLPFFLLGKLFHEKQDELTQYIKPYWVILTTGIGFLIITIGFLLENGWGYLGVILFSGSLFFFTIIKPDIKVSFLCNMGNGYEFFIYMIILLLCIFLMHLSQLMIN